MKKVMRSWALVTGASSGIGEEICYELAKKKINIVLAGRNKDEINRVKENILKINSVETDVFLGDLTAEGECERLIKNMGGRYHLQFLFNNAGFGLYGPFVEQSLEKNLKLIDLNIKALTRLTYLCAHHMKAHGKDSYITNISSIAAFFTVPFFGVYSGTKKYVKDFSESIEYELKNTNIHVCTVDPGPTATNFMKNAGMVPNAIGKRFLMSAKKVAVETIKATLKNKRNTFINLTNRVLVFYSFIPNTILIPLGGSIMKLSSRYKRVSENLDYKNKVTNENNDTSRMEK